MEHDMDRREFLTILAAAVAGPPKPADPIDEIEPWLECFDDTVWVPWVQYIEPGKPVTFEYPFHLRSFGVDAPGRLPDVSCGLMVNEAPVTDIPIAMLVQNGRALPVFPTIEIPAGTRLQVELRGQVPDVIFCVEGNMKRPVEYGPLVDFDWDDEDEDEDESDDEGWF